MSEVAVVVEEPSTLLWDEIAAALATQGYIVLEQCLPMAMTYGLIAHLASVESTLRQAGVGRNQDYQLNQTIRRDKIQWLEPDVPVVSDFLLWMDALRIALNERLFLGLFDFESHFAIYEPGAFYHKHYDAFHGASGRKLSTVLYLNEAWDNTKGGELVLYDGTGDKVVESIEPICGRMVIFLSEEFPHEVRVAYAKRQSIAGWFRIKPL